MGYGYTVLLSAIGVYAVGNAIIWVGATMVTVSTQVDPLVLDIDGDGNVDTSGMGFLDHDKNGFAELSAWAC